jgi:rod shape-determining protein MreD
MPDRTPGIRPRQSLWRRLDLAARHSFPATSVVLLMLLASAPVGVPGQPQLQQAVTLAGVFFWTLFRPGNMVPAVVFAIGVLSDLIGLSPVGVSVFVLLLTHGLAMRWRGLVRQSFLLVWLSFIAVAALASLLGWGLTCLLNVRLLPPSPALFQFALSAALYPMLAAFFTRAHRGIADPGQA